MDDSCVDLYWLPLGAGGRSVRWNGRIFEELVARYERRSPLDLYHSALEVRVSDATYTEVHPMCASMGTPRRPGQPGE
jgi:hypothetical protein